MKKDYDFANQNNWSKKFEYYSEENDQNYRMTILELRLNNKIFPLNLKTLLLIINILCVVSFI